MCDIKQDLPPSARVAVESNPVSTKPMGYRRREGADTPPRDAPRGWGDPDAFHGEDD